MTLPSVRAFGACVALFVSCVCVPSAFAQDKKQKPPEKASHWGIDVSFTPKWDFVDKLQKVIVENGTVNIQGTQFSIGFVRGSTLGGDWGVSFQQMPFKDGTGTVEIKQQCISTQCFTETETHALHNTMAKGFEVHWFKPFGTIKRRVQLGINIGGGIGTMSGTDDGVVDSMTQVGFNQKTGQPILGPSHTTTSENVKDSFLPIFPFIKLEAEGAVIITHQFKFKIAGGVNFPSVGVRVLGTYLIGAK